MNQAPNLGRLLCWSKYGSQHKKSGIEKWWKDACCPKVTKSKNADFIWQIFCILLILNHFCKILNYLVVIYVYRDTKKWNLSFNKRHSEKINLNLIIGVLLIHLSALLVNIWNKDHKHNVSWFSPWYRKKLSYNKYWLSFWQTNL